MKKTRAILKFAKSENFLHFILHYKGNRSLVPSRFRNLVGARDGAREGCSQGNLPAVIT